MTTHIAPLDKFGTLAALGLLSACAAEKNLSCEHQLADQIPGTGTVTVDYEGIGRSPKEYQVGVSPYTKHPSLSIRGCAADGDTLWVLGATWHDIPDELPADVHFREEEPQPLFGMTLVTCSDETCAVIPTRPWSATILDPPLGSGSVSVYDRQRGRFSSTVEMTADRQHEALRRTLRLEVDIAWPPIASPDAGNTLDAGKE